MHCSLPVTLHTWLVTVNMFSPCATFLSFLYIFWDVIVLLSLAMHGYLSMDGKQFINNQFIS